MKTYVLLDRSGSMERSWGEMIGAITALMKEISQKSKSSIFVFDRTGGGMEAMTAIGGQFQFYEVFSGKAKKFTHEVFKNFGPRGSTPLYDAIAELGKHIEIDKPSKAQIVIVTDGFENSSQRVGQQQAKALVESWKDKKFDIVYLGASFGGALASAAELGIDHSKTVNMRDASTYSATMTAVATRNTDYSAGSVDSDSDLGEVIRKHADS